MRVVAKWWQVVSGGYAAIGHYVTVTTIIRNMILKQSRKMKFYVKSWVIFFFM